MGKLQESYKEKRLKRRGPEDVAVENSTSTIDKKNVLVIVEKQHMVYKAYKRPRLARIEVTKSVWKNVADCAKLYPASYSAVFAPIAAIEPEQYLFYKISKMPW